MRSKLKIAIVLSTAVIALASCGATQVGDSSDTDTGTDAPPEPAQPFTISEHGSFDQPWALAMEPGTNRIFITEKPGGLKWYDPASGASGSVDSGLPEVDYGGQGGFGDIAFAPDYQSSRTIYLTWAEAGDGDTSGAVMGRGTLACEAESCAVEGLQVIWRQVPKTGGRGHFSHRIAFSPDGQYLFLASGDRQQAEPAQDLGNNLGAVLRLNPDGTPAAGNPFADQGGVTREIWSYGHRNTLGLQFDPQGQLWNLEHGPAGGDELNKVEEGRNYGWPTVSDGDNYNGDPIPDHNTRPEFATPAITWTPVLAPGDFIFYDGDMWPDWRGNALIAGLRDQSITRVAINAEGSATEQMRYRFDKRLRDIMQGPEGALWVIEDGPDGRLLRLTAD